MAPALSSYEAESSHSASHLVQDYSPTACEAEHPPVEHLDLLSGLGSMPKSVPCSYLYDAYGSELYDQIVDLPEYYPYRTELAMLEKHMPSITQHIAPGSVIIELGCGSATKTGLILNALLERDGQGACYFEGIDCSAEFLQSARTNLQAACPGLLPDHLGTICALYLDGLKEARHRHPGKVLCVLWLGSSVGNLDKAAALTFFKDMLQIGGAGTQVFLCADLWKDAHMLHAAYCDSQGVTESFIKNGLTNALSVLGVPMPFKARDWTYDVVINADLQQVEMWLVAPYDVHIPGTDITIRQGERLLMEVSRKFTQPHLRGLALEAGWCWQAAWASNKYSMQMLATPDLAFASCWADTDSLFAGMADWSSHPITVRHPFCFYYGHVAAFAKLKVLPEDPPSSWDEMFSRGIDPDVLDPSKCHDHPDAPDVWPTKSEIIDYCMKVRQQLREALQAGCFDMRGVCIALEHERMHQETLAYMKAQQRRTAFEAQMQAGVSKQQEQVHCNGHASSNGQLAGGSQLGNGGRASQKQVAPGQPRGMLGMKHCPGGMVMLGTDTASSMSGFVWDNEGPQQESIKVEAFAAAAGAVTVRDFKAFMEDHGYDRPELWDAADFQHMKRVGQGHPATWTVKDKDVWVHTNESSKHWIEVADEPVWVSLAEAQAFCKARNARIMTEPEYLCLLNHNGMSGQSWHKLRTGGWEWTATPFAALHGFQPMQEYPEYSTDFYDGKHMVLKGSAPVTHASVMRDSFRNFYQRQYPFMFAKFRCCMSVPK